MNKEIQISPRQIAQAVDNLLDEKIKLQQRIDKAVEYINDNRRADLVFKLHLNEEEVDKLLEILKGEDNDR